MLSYLAVTILPCALSFESQSSFMALHLHQLWKSSEKGQCLMPYLYFEDFRPFHRIDLSNIPHLLCLLEPIWQLGQNVSRRKIFYEIPLQVEEIGQRAILAI